ncbi:MAG: hypothetical protein PHQ75_05165 [Thermoguttaceae bacterium]|nr:hypothetical protein [Thermoguttaceae bacterium]
MTSRFTIAMNTAEKGAYSILFPLLISVGVVLLASPLFAQEQLPVGNGNTSLVMTSTGDATLLWKKPQSNTKSELSLSDARPATTNASPLSSPENLQALLSADSVRAPETTTAATQEGQVRLVRYATQDAPGTLAAPVPSLNKPALSDPIPQTPASNPLAQQAPASNPLAQQAPAPNPLAQQAPAPLNLGNPLGTEAIPVPRPNIAPLRPNAANAPRGKAETYVDTCPDPKSLPKIKDLSYKVVPQPGQFPESCPLPDEVYYRKAPTPVTFQWKASCLCHKPLYFEDVQLERYGHTSCPILQPAISRVCFWLTIPVLPYFMGVNPPNECVYELGYYRPGSCAPHMLSPLPLSLRGGLMQAGAVVGAAYLIP